MCWCGTGTVVNRRYHATKSLARPHLSVWMCVTDPRFLPYVGMVTIVLNEYPKAKYVLVGIMALFVLTSKE